MPFLYTPVSSVASKALDEIKQSVYKMQPPLLDGTIEGKEKEKNINRGLKRIT